MVVIRLGYQVLYQKGITKLTFVQLEYTMWQMPAFSYDLMNARPVHHDLQPTREKMRREKKKQFCCFCSNYINSFTTVGYLLEVF